LIAILLWSPDAIGGDQTVTSMFLKDTALQVLPGTFPMIKKTKELLVL